MNIKNIFKIINFKFFSFNLLLADEKKDVLDEELPAVNPFLSGAGASGSSSMSAADGSGKAISLNNLKLSGIIFGESTRYAIFSFLMEQQSSMKKIQLFKPI